MTCRTFLFFCLLWLGSTSESMAYEVDTHSLITFHAFDRSALAQPSTLERLGFSRYDLDQPFHLPDDAMPYTLERDAYFDYVPTAWPDQISESYRRKINDHELNQFPFNYRGAQNSAQQLDLRAWLMRGAVREDDLLLTDYEGTPPEADPFGDITRVYHHFYDPVFDRPLTLPLGFPCGALPGGISGGCVKSTDWAMGVTDAAGASPSGPNLTRRNHSSYVDARAAMWCALTYQAPNTLNGAIPDAGRRRVCWATAIKAIGHVLHLLQDSAQPQHVRNDRHNPPTSWWTSPFATMQARRIYESWINYRAIGTVPLTTPNDEYKGYRKFFRNEETVSPLVNGSYPKPIFSKPVEYFTTRASDPSISARRGLADFANRNFYSEGTIYSNEYASPPSIPGAVGLSFADRPGGFVTGYGGLIIRDVLWSAVDTLNPGYVDPLSAFGGKIPLLTESIWTGLGAPAGDRQVISLEHYSAHADVLIPRAIAYSTGLIDYFFRGKLEITPNDQKVFAVLNQGEPHTVNALGYPYKPDDTIFGFEKVRLRIRNITDAITESGPTTAPIAQTSGSGTMVAVARYHRNACYQPDMGGERVRGYAPPPALGAITEPTCVLPQRTPYEEISVSAPITISSSADLPGGEGVAGPAVPVDQTFDFSADPIPVNATDLFIQVIYRGQLGEEPDGIAVGTHDVREPTYVGIFNNTDYYWNGLATVPRWIGQQPTFFPQQNADFLRVCVGAGGNSRWAYYAQPTAGFPALGVPPQPGVVRLAMIFPLPTTLAQLFFVRVTPVMDVTSAPQLSYSTRGQQRQANKERISEAVLNDPQICAPTPPTTATYWCNDPINRRRGLSLGEVVAPIYYTNGGVSVGDVDAQPLPVFSGLQIKTDGPIKFNDVALTNCPPALI